VKKYLKTVLLSAIIVMILLVFMPQMQVQAEVRTGTMGDHDGILWTYDETERLLTITGSDSGMDKECVENVNITPVSPFYRIDPNIVKIVVRDCSILGSADNLFSYMLAVESIVFENFDTSKVTSMASMFEDCIKLKNLDVSGFDTSNVDEMEFMFYGCKSLTKLDVSKFNTANVIDFAYMFGECNNLTKIDVSGFDTGKAVVMRGMFVGCLNLTGLDVSGFNTSTVVHMEDMFNRCRKLSALDVSGFDTANVNCMNEMFRCCSSLTKLDVSGFDTSNVINMGSMFQFCENVKVLDVSQFDTSQVENMGYMFSSCYDLTKLDVSGFDTSQVEDMGYMFYDCSALTVIDVSGFDTAQVNDMSGMFYNCKKVTTLDVGKFNTSAVDDMADMFTNCSAVKTLNMMKFDTSNADVTNMLSGCSALTTIRTPKKMGEGQVVTLRTTFYDIEDQKWKVISAENTNRTISTTKLTFVDVDSFSWQYTPVKYVYSKKIMVGKSENELGKVIFDPNANMTRAEFVQSLYNKEGKPSVKVTDGVFTDVESGDWYAKAVIWATNKGIVSGKGDRFGVSDKITREEVATILYNYAKYKKLSTKKLQDFTGYADADQISSWAVDKLQWALAYGVMKGKGDRLDPKGNATRAECATMIKNFIDAY